MITASTNIPSLDLLHSAGLKGIARVPRRRRASRIASEWASEFPRIERQITKYFETAN